MVEGYCMRCKSKREIVNPVTSTMKNGREAYKGTCTVCGTNMFKFKKSGE